MAIKLIKACKELNVGMATAVEFLAKQGMTIDVDPNLRIDDDVYMRLAKEFNKDMALKMEAERQQQQRQERDIQKVLTLDSAQEEADKKAAAAAAEAAAAAKKAAEEAAAKKAAEEAAAAAKKAAEEAAEAAAQKAAEEAANAAAEAARKAAEDAAATVAVTQTEMGSTADGAMKIYLRPETAQGIFVNFLNVQKTGRMKIPFGIAQIGKAFRNEIVARQFVFRMREFEQMEMQFFVRPGEELKWFEHWKAFRLKWHKALGLGDDKYRYHDHEKLAHYANAATDIEFQMPFGFKEVEGIHSRTNFDLSQHAKYSGKKIEYFDPELNQSYTPYVIETSIGVDRMFLSVMCGSYKEEQLEGGDVRVVLSLPPVLAPVKACIMPLVKKDGLPELAHKIMDELKFDFRVQYDEKDSIGKRYRRQDAIGTPFCITVDHDSLNDGCVTLRYRDTMEQDRVKIEDLHEIICRATDAKELYRKIVGDKLEDTEE